MVNTCMTEIQPIEGFHLNSGYDCLTVSIQRMCSFYKYDISEEMLFGLGSGLGFSCWKHNNALPLIDGRSSTDSFSQKLCERIGIRILEHSTFSPPKAMRSILTLVNFGIPVMMYGDVSSLPYWQAENAADGTPVKPCPRRHAFITVGTDADSSHLLLADLEPGYSGKRRGRYEYISADELLNALRGKYTGADTHYHWFTFDFSLARAPESKDYYLAIYETLLQMMRPASDNLGLKGMRRLAFDLKYKRSKDQIPAPQEILQAFARVEKISSFRSMYANFLEQARQETGNPWLEQSARLFDFAAEQWLGLLRPLQNASQQSDPAFLLANLAEDLEKVSCTEETALKMLASALPQA